MKFIETSLSGVFIVELEPIEDERGFFARSWCSEEFKKRRLVNTLRQCNISFNKKKGTIRGMHYQGKPYEETKLVRCTKGSIYDVIIDLRPSSSTFKKNFGIELSELNHRMLYIPVGLAHGFQTLEDQTEVFYQMSQYFHESYARGIRWNDPAFSIRWPLPISYISSKDNNYEDFKK